MPETTHNSTETSQKPEMTPEIEPDRVTSGGGNDPLRPLRRLRQLAEEIQNALAREDMSVVRQASSLLAPTLAQWAERRSETPPRNAEMENLSRETRAALTDCEEAMRLAMERNRTRATEIRQHRGRLRKLRAHHSHQVRSRILRDA